MITNSMLMAKMGKFGSFTKDERINGDILKCAKAYIKVMNVIYCKECLSKEVKMVVQKNRLLLHTSERSKVSGGNKTHNNTNKLLCS